PLLQADLAEPRAVRRDQRALAEFGPEVSRVRVSDHFARIVTRADALSNQVIKTEPLWTSDFNDAVQGRTDGGPRDRLGDIISGYRLNQQGGQSNCRSVSGFVSDASDELKDMRRVDDRVRDPACLDQRFLCALRAK